MRKHLVLILIFLISCSSGSSNKSPTLNIESPAANEVFRAGDTITIRIAVRNFTLEEPNNVSHAQPRNGDHESETMHKGHYHVYFDSCEGEHITAWHVSEDDGTTQVSILDYELASSTSAGSHFLCVDLRNSNHEQLGIISTVDITVE